jgi:D-glycero-alpha-D-manno-heptose-7-phosphate kinase
MIDEIYEDALAEGALGGKLLGAGGGGFLMLFVSPDDQDRVAHRLKNLVRVPIRFENAGSQIIFLDPEVDYSREDEERSLAGPRVYRELSDCFEDRASTRAEG